MTLKGKIKKLFGTSVIYLFLQTTTCTLCTMHNDVYTVQCTLYNDVQCTMI